MSTAAYREKNKTSEPDEVGEPPESEIVLLDTIRKLDELTDDDIARVLRALRAYYEDPT